MRKNNSIKNPDRSIGETDAMPPRQLALELPQGLAASLALALAVALGVGAVEAALEGPGVGGRRADALGSGPVARAGRRRRRPEPPRLRILGAVAGRFT